MFTTRADVIARRSYSRPKEDGSFETWLEVVDRVIDHQRWLWERARGRKLGVANEKELEELRALMLQRKGLTAGRSLWLGGTEIVKRREASAFNCAFTNVETVHDAVDFAWLLLQGCGVGGNPTAGALNGFSRPIKNIVTKRSTRLDRGRENNVETWDNETKTWTISVGDSAEAWAKALGKLLAGKYPTDTLVIDTTEIRPGGVRLNGYGWISSGDAALVKAMLAIATILNRRAGHLLTRHDIHDILNWMGTILSSRRSAEIMLYEHGSPGWETFATFKKDFWLAGNDQRQQSNNSLLFWTKPSKADLKEIFGMMMAAGGSEPGFINAEAASRRSPGFAGVNPCAEILGPNKFFCNLVELNVAAFLNDPSGLHRAQTLLARANYRATCVDLRDGILQTAWHENNQFHRLCGTGLTGIAMRPDLTAYDYKALRNSAIIGANGMADELGLPRPKNTTTIKPSGTLSKIMDTTEGAHKPLGRYILNNVKFGSHDPLVPALRDAGYRVFDSPNPTDTDTVIITLPAKFDGVPFEVVDGVPVNLETAVQQLERYKLLMDSYVDHNCSVTISYDPSEVDAIVDWLHYNWDSYVGVSWLYRVDPTKSAADLGYDYLPQEVVSQKTYDEYVAKLLPFSLDEIGGDELVDAECATGACPIR